MTFIPLINKEVGGNINYIKTKKPSLTNERQNVSF
jgi:hypothetical protein